MTDQIEWDHDGAPLPEPLDMDGLFPRPERRVRMLAGAVPERARQPVRTVTVRGGVL